MKILSRVAGMIVAVSAVTQAQAPAHLSLEPLAKQQIDGMVWESLRYWQERQACVSGWHMALDTLVIEQVSKDPGFAYADSERTFSFTHLTLSGMHADVCGDSLPMVHTHLPTRGASGVAYPSETDWHTLEERPRMQFGLLITVMDKNTGEYMPGIYGHGEVKKR